jgi:hypothetical protein
MLDTASTGFNITKHTTLKMRRTSSFTNGNVKCKLEIFEGVLSDLQTELKNLRNDTAVPTLFD